MPSAKKYKREVYISPRLEEKLSRITSFPCTVMAAPTGYGKSAATREFFAREQKRSGIRPLWQTVMKNEGGYFWEDFIRTLCGLDPAFSGALAEGLPLDIPQRRRFKDAFLALLDSLKEELVLIIDAGACAFDGQTVGFLEYLIQLIPGGVHLVLLARQSPLAADSVLEYYGLINAVTIKDLLFTAQDIEDYYRLCGVQLSHREAARLSVVTEGWAALVQENLEEMLEKGSGISEKRAEQIIDRMVYDPLEQDVREFLPRMGLCQAFSLSQAEYMFPGKNVKAILADLTQKNLFLSFDHFHRVDYYEVQEFRWTNCFASCIARKSKEISEEESAAILTRAGDWCMEMDVNYCVMREYYYRAKNFDALMRGVEKRRFLRPYVEDDYLFISYYTDCPPEIRMRYPKAILTFAKYLHNSNRRELAEKVAMEFLRLIQENPDLSEGHLKQYRAMYELLLTYERYNNLEGMLEHLRKTVTLIENEPDKFIWPESGLNEVPSILYMYHRKAGEMEKEVRLFTEYNMMYTQFTNHYTAGAELVMEAEAQYMRGDSRAAEITVYKARLIANRRKQWCVWVSAIYLQLRIELDRGSWQKAEALLDEARGTYVPELDGFSFIPASDMLQAYVCCKLNQPDGIAAMFKPGWDERFYTNYRTIVALYAMYAEVLLVRREYIALIALADSYLETARFYPNLLVEIILEIEIAGAYEKLFERKNALLHLKKALLLAQPDQIIMPFVELSQYIGHLLPLASEGVEAAFLSAIIGRADEFREKMNAIRLKYFINNGMHQLTQQEMKVARLAADGCSNREIAEALVVGESTIKTHLTHVFSKLEIEKRSQLKALFPPER